MLRRRVRRLLPACYLAFAERAAHHGENFVGLPGTARGLFLAHAFLWGAPPGGLDRYADVPRVRAELFHVEKLAHAAEAQGGRRWVRRGISRAVGRAGGWLPRAHYSRYSHNRPPAGSWRRRSRAGGGPSARAPPPPDPPASGKPGGSDQPGPCRLPAPTRPPPPVLTPALVTACG
jgi:hypothetical protein